MDADGVMRIGGRSVAAREREERMARCERLAARMEVCRTCLGLRGPFTDDFDRCERIQRCACEPEEPLWNAYDYNRGAELCRCCVAAIVSSGSRWSHYFCAECHERIVAYDRAMGGAVIPIGRHSLMNGFSLPAKEARLPRARAVFVKKLLAMGTSSTTLHRWAHARTAEVVRGIPGTSGAIPVRTYLLHARAVFERDEAFEELVREVERAGR